MEFGDQPWVETSLDKPIKEDYLNYKKEFGLKIGVAFGGWGQSKQTIGYRAARS
jgi:hypothetical protein